MEQYLKRSWAEIDLDALDNNIRAIQLHLKPGVLFMGVVKADAYGHGAQQIARRLEQKGVNWLGVSNLEEGMVLRRAGIKLPILVFGTTPPELASELARLAITQAVYALEYAQALQKAAFAQGVVVNCHLKLDTGMSRLGFLCDEKSLSSSVQDAACACALPNLSYTGVFTHFASADEAHKEGKAYTRRQFKLFIRAIDMLKERGISFALRHCCNSAAILSYPEFQLDMVRAGVILYGMLPSPECPAPFALKPIMQLRSEIASVKQVPAQTQVSYGRIYTAPCSSTLAVVPIGYADGYQRGLSNRACMLVHGKRAPVVGRVCMDQTMIDVSGIPQVKRGDSVTVFGEQEGCLLPVEELSHALNSINYEFTCLISKRIPRVYLENGRVVEVFDINLL